MGLSGALNISERMEQLQASLMLNRVPGSWEDFAYYSKKALGAWFSDMIERVNQLSSWSGDLVLPKSLWISGLFNPMSFLTSIMQTTARSKNLPLDNMVLHTYVTNVFDVDEI